MSLMSTMPDGSYDAVITDPPYATGGTSSAARAQDSTRQVSVLHSPQVLPDVCQ